MITDAQLMFSDSQVITGGPSTLAATNVVDMQASRNLERTGAKLRIVSEVTTSLAGGTSVQVQIIQSTVAAMTSPDVIASGPVVALANAVAGRKLLDIPMPGADPLASKEFMGAQYVLLGTFTGTGAIWTGIVMNDEGGELRLGVTGF